ncbi:hypothetical protein [Kitasatospora viridis]|uniref:PknH-like protein n=1 Tax=Kitasatospora viridis TaxID=281105 RepID=A0A561UH12_9ACTN|nr:hypothetical protein [Kitasatospora viridis]TWF98641.1 hypothetical protein FHX73_112462 [Kitasatospora viridis]
MTEQPATPEDPAVPRPSRPLRPPRPLRAAALAVTAVLATAAVGVAVGLGVLAATRPEHAGTVGPTPVPGTAHETPAAGGPVYGAHSDGTHFGALSDLLLPVPAGFSLGLNGGDAGADTEAGADLTGDQLAGELDAQLDLLPAAQRSAARTRLQGAHPRTGTRGYTAADGHLVASIWLDQFAGSADAGPAGAVFATAWSGAGTDYRQGPSVPGHPEVSCVLPSTRPSAPIDELDCAAVVGDVLVTMRVEGAAPLPKSEAVSMFRQQLERLAIPGASA